MFVVGLQRSHPVPVQESEMMLASLGHIRLSLGDSAITHVLRAFLLPDGGVELNPLAVAGWFGLLVTGLNLLPLGQLDGGHVLYALFRDRQKVIGVIAWAGLVVLSHWFWPWLIWAGLILFLGGGRLAHPTVLWIRRPSTMTLTRYRISLLDSRVALIPCSLIA